MSNKIKELIVLLEKEKTKVRKLEQEVARLKAITLSTLVDTYDEKKEQDENISG